jgi:hypothetical protein
MIVKVEDLLRGGAVYTTVGVVHFETSSGVLNNVEQVKETSSGGPQCSGTGNTETSSCAHKM